MKLTTKRVLAIYMRSLLEHLVYGRVLTAQERRALKTQRIRDFANNRP